MSDQGQLSLHSIAFSHGGHIPPLYTCEGKDINPPIEISGIPGDAKSLALIMEDPDAPNGTFYHWLMWNIPPQNVINENNFKNNNYGGPCPPDGEHRYFFRIFALDTELELKEGSSHPELVKAMEGHILASGDIMGYYKKRGQTEN